MVNNGEASNGKSLMTAQEVSAYLKVPRSTLYGLTKKGEIPGKKVGKHWRYFAEDVYNYLVQSADHSPASRINGNGNGNPAKNSPQEILIYGNGQNGIHFQVGELVRIIFRIPGDQDPSAFEIEGRIVRSLTKEEKESGSGTDGLSGGDKGNGQDTF